MQGNPIKSKDLHKAGIKRARAVIILSKPTTDFCQFDMLMQIQYLYIKQLKMKQKIH